MEHHGSGDSTVSDEVDIARLSYRNIGDGDTVDARFQGIGCSRQSQAASTPSSADDVLPDPGVSRDDEEYFMGNPNRGVALIFSHEKFDFRTFPDGGNQPKPRHGTNIDRDRLHHTFRGLGFEVLCFDDLCFNEIRNELIRVADQTHSSRDCVAVAVLTHGDRDGMLDAKDRDYRLSQLWEPFTARKCPSLAGKPKLFFIQACKGDDTDQGQLVSHITTDAANSGHNAELSYPVPSYADILVSYSTFEGQFSYRNPESGSWYIRTLCSQLDTHGKTKDLVSLLIDVNRIVGQKFRSENRKNPQLHGMVQGPCFTLSLTRRLSFGQSGHHQSSRSSPGHDP